jgi:probable phosphoglycerate mutase
MRSGPRAIWLVRHGESEGNVAREAAHRDRLHEIGLGTRDADVPLSARGEDQARAFGQWLAAQPEDRRPTVVLASPYVRAVRTAEIALKAAGHAVPPLTIDLDERLRDREMGVLEDLTWHGIIARHPQEAERAQRLGKFGWRPPGGESWADICLRLRSVYADVAREFADDRVLVVAHDAVIQLTRVVMEGLSEAKVVELSKRVYANCALTAYERGDDGYVLTAYNEVVG